MCEHRATTIQWTDLEMPSLSGHYLDQPFTEAEIRIAIKEMPVENSPGPDGSNGVFFLSLLGCDQA
jgi:hypothetical protein